MARCHLVIAIISRCKPANISCAFCNFKNVFFYGWIKQIVIYSGRPRGRVPGSWPPLPPIRPCLRLKFLHRQDRISLFNWPIFLIKRARERCSMVAYFTSRIQLQSKAPCKRTQHCWPTTPNIVGCYMLRPFAHPVACCCAKFQTLCNNIQQHATGGQTDAICNIQQCCVRLHAA